MNVRVAQAHQLFSSDLAGRKPSASEDHSVQSAIEGFPNADIFRELVEIAETEAALPPSEAWTIFLPTDAAFHFYGAAFVERMLNTISIGRVREFVGQFIIPGHGPLERFSGRKIWATNLNQRKVLINAKEGFAFEGASIVKADLTVPGGTVHLMSRFGRSPRLFVPTVRTDGMSQQRDVVQAVFA
ncbi:MAG: fasciclin domain-containing protein [Pseudomonadota bacterium]